jgi:hypothetical protein
VNATSICSRCWLLADEKLLLDSACKLIILALQLGLYGRNQHTFGLGLVTYGLCLIFLRLCVVAVGSLRLGWFQLDCLHAALVHHLDRTVVGVFTEMKEAGLGPGRCKEHAGGVCLRRVSARLEEGCKGV